jgi:hypothetical protein
MADEMLIAATRHRTTTAAPPVIPLEIWSFDDRRGRDTMRGTAEELERWTGASRRYRDALDAALEELNTVQRRRWRLPGSRRRARQRYRARVRTATETYLPVCIQIEDRWEVERLREREEARRKAEEQRRRADQLRILEREHGAELAARYRAVAEQAVWAWVDVDVGNRAVAWVYRTDVAAGDAPRGAQRRSAEPLTARRLEQDLLNLYVDEIRWDDAARRKTLEECSTTPLEPNFLRWWLAVTAEEWRSDRELPRPYCYQTWRRRPSSHHGHGSSDYGGGHYGFCSW